MTRTARLLAVALLTGLVATLVAHLPAATAHRAMSEEAAPIRPGGAFVSRSASAAGGASAPETVAVVDGAALAAQFSSQPEAAATAVAQATAVLPVAGAPFDVEDDMITLVDPTRSTPARGWVAAKPERTLRTVVRRPVGVAGPMPLVVFAHGYNAEPEMYESLLDAWAAAGYLVAAPELPGSARDLPGSPVRSDIAEQATDLSFVISSLLDGRAGPVDPFHIAAAGHSDGGSTVTVLALDHNHFDGRIAAYLVMAGDVPEGVAGDWGAGDPNATMLVAVGDQDEYGNLPASTSVFQQAGMAKALVVARGGDHLGTFVDDTATADSMRGVTVRFLDQVLRGGDADTGSLVGGLTLEPSDTMLRLTHG